MDFYGSWVFSIDKLYLYLLTLGTSVYLVYQVSPAYGSTSYPNVRDYKGRTGLSYLSPTPQLKGIRQTKVASSLDTTSTLSTTTLALRRAIHLYQGPSN
jgi:hypothetical protein